MLARVFYFLFYDSLDLALLTTMIAIGLAARDHAPSPSARASGGGRTLKPATDPHARGGGALPLVGVDTARAWLTTRPSRRASTGCCASPLPDQPQLVVPLDPGARPSW